jgi:hypothetical protein
VFPVPVPEALSPVATAPAGSTLLTTALPPSAGFQAEAHAVTDETSESDIHFLPEKPSVWADLLCWQLSGMCAGLLGVLIALAGQKMDPLMRGVALLLLMGGVLVGGVAATVYGLFRARW